MSNLVVTIVPYSETWIQGFRGEEIRLRPMIETVSGKTDHIGSTAIPEMPAKPVIDILITIPNWDDADTLSTLLISMGYSLGKSPEASSERMFMERLDPENQDTAFINLHITSEANESGREMIMFRNALRADKTKASQYSDLKRTLGTKHADDLQS